jgi:hypothetical protein
VRRTGDIDFARLLKKEGEGGCREGSSAQDGDECARCTSMDLIMKKMITASALESRLLPAGENPGNGKSQACAVQLAAPCSSPLPLPAVALPPHLTQNCAVGLCVCVRASVVCE